MRNSLGDVLMKKQKKFLQDYGDLRAVDRREQFCAQLFDQNNTRIANIVVSKKNGTFICELILESYKYLRNTQKRLKITIYGRIKSFLEF